MQRGELIEVNSKCDLGYTYHRHSAPKDVIYYRCSDKRCKARFHFNPKTKEYRLKNRHLDASEHKPPKLKGAKKIELQMEIPLLEPKIRMEELRCEESLPSMRANLYVCNSEDRDATSFHLSLWNASDAHRLCEKAVSSGLAYRACCTDRGLMYTIEHDRLVAHTCGIHVSLEVSASNESFVRDFVHREISPCPPIDEYVIVSKTGVTT